MAPALMKGLRGMPRSYSSWTMELKGLPDGSRPTRLHSRSPTLPSASVSVNTLEMLWIENGTSLSPPAATLPSASTTARPNAPRIDAREFRDVGRDLAAVGPLPHLLGNLAHDAGKVGHGLFFAISIDPQPVGRLRPVTCRHSWLASIVV